MTDTATSTLPVALIIMDGFGLAPASPGNAITLADTPRLDNLFATYPHTEIAASGEAVGLPDGQMGNSEVGHLNIGAGRVVHQELTRINMACDNGDLARNEVLQAAFADASKQGSVLHLMGLLSDGGVHSSDAHLFALIDAAVSSGVRDIHIHCFMDGRDVPPSSGNGYLSALEKKLSQLPSTVDAHIASIEGRYYAMDRDNRWDRVERAYVCMTSCEPFTDDDPDAYIARSYENGITDEFVEPVSFTHRGIRSCDSVVFFNFRPDRAREISRSLVDRDFAGFTRKEDIFPHFVCLTEYDPTIDAAVAFPKTFPENVLADVVAEAGLRQYHIAETEKYAHVTFFLNGGREQPKTNEQRALVDSPKVATYDLQPEMSEPAVTDTLVDAIRNDTADVYIVNFANCDMVGHTGSIPAATAAVEAVDSGVGRVIDALLEKGGCALVTADHGNADRMLAEDGTPFTAHTTAPVPLILVADSDRSWDLASGHFALCNIAPTLLDMAGLSIPCEMTAQSMLVKR